MYYAHQQEILLIPFDTGFSFMTAVAVQHPLKVQEILNWQGAEL